LNDIINIYGIDKTLIKSPHDYWEESPILIEHPYLVVNTKEISRAGG
jgi:hypothetical protein